MITPHHQFEIRYTTILNFPVVIRPTLAPFVKPQKDSILKTKALITKE